MENLAVRILEKLFIIYFLGYFILDLMLFIIFIIRFRKEGKAFDGKLPFTSIIVPAFNEEVSIVNCVRMLSGLDFQDYEVVIVNDGSTDMTTQVLENEYDFTPAETGSYIPVLKTMRVRSVKTALDGRLILIDKENGGKADSINAGICQSKGELICTIDADSILDRSSLRAVVQEMVQDESVFVAGGQIAVANDTVIHEGRVVNARMPSNLLVLWQIIEYIKSFLVSRFGLGRINSILIMSGAFSLFRKNDLIEAGGFLAKVNDSQYIKAIFKETRSTVCEDMEIVVRLWRLYREKKRKGRAIYMSRPLCWTEVPDNFASLFKQRARWHMGLAESLYFHRKMMFDPAYGVTGLFAMPFYFFFELISPVIKLAALLFLLYVSISGLVNTQWVVLMAVLITATAALVTSIVTVLVENWSEKQSARNRSALRYKSFADWLILLLFSILSDFTYAFFKIAAQFKGLADFAMRKNEWNKFERKGIRSVEAAVNRSK